MQSTLQFQSVTEKLGTEIDGRTLYFEIEFCAVPHEIVKDVAIAFFCFVQDFYRDQFVASWGFPEGDKRIKHPKDCIGEIKNSHLLPKMIVEAVVRSPSLQTKTNLRQFIRKLSYDNSSSIHRSYSNDFGVYFRENIEPFIESDSLLKIAVLNLFQEQNRVPVKPFPAVDSRGMFYSMPENLGSSLSHGTINFSLAVECIKPHLNEIAIIFAEEIKSLCLRLINACGRVGISCREDGYNQYKGYFRERDLKATYEDMPVECRPLFWERMIYLHGCEWTNVLSPIANRWLRRLPNKSQQVEELIIEPLPTQGILVQINKPISEVDVQDLLKAKRFLYPALYPGYSQIPIQYFMNHQRRSCGFDPLENMPRNNWVRLPVFPEEVQVRQGIIIFEKTTNT